MCFDPKILLKDSAAYSRSAYQSDAFGGEFRFCSSYLFENLFARGRINVHTVAFTVHTVALTVHTVALTVHTVALTVHTVALTVHAVALTVHTVALTVPPQTHSLAKVAITRLQSVANTTIRAQCQLFRTIEVRRATPTVSTHLRRRLESPLG
eukprot:1182174-Prorocentrum_minimum.AAC.1